MPRKLKKRGVPPDGLVIVQSPYTKLSCLYLRNQYPQVDQMLHNLENSPKCQYYSLRYPLLSVLRAAARKLLLNFYECVVFGYLLHKGGWNVDAPVIAKHIDKFPDVLYINDPTDPVVLKMLTLFVYLTTYSVKEFLAEDISVYRQEMLKLCPSFEYIYQEWLSEQATIDTQIDPKRLNEYYKVLSGPVLHNNYNELVDRVLHISPCYAILDKESSSSSVPNSQSTHQSKGSCGDSQMCRKYSKSKPLSENHVNLFCTASRQEVKQQDIEPYEFDNYNHNSGIYNSGSHHHHNHQMHHEHELHHNHHIVDDSHGLGLELRNLFPHMHEEDLLSPRSDSNYRLMRSMKRVSELSDLSNAPM